MKRILLALLLVCVIISPKTEHGLSLKVIEVRYELPDPEIGEYYVRIDGFSLSNVDGVLLPTKRLFVLLPPGASDVKIEWIALRVEEFSRHLEQPEIEVRPLCPENSSIIVPLSKREWELISEEKIEWINGSKVLSFLFTPVRYSSGKVKIYREVLFIIEFKEEDVNNLPNPTEDVLELVINPWDAKFYEYRHETRENRLRLQQGQRFCNISTGKADYLIITTNELASEFSRLRDWKIGIGTETEIVTVDWINSNCSGVDLQEKIRNFIRDAYLEWGVKYVLLGGDYTEIPPRYFYMEEPYDWGFPYGTFQKATDFYYSALGDWDPISGTWENGDWDPDDNGLYLEQLDLDVDGFPEYCKEPIPDFSPEVFVGRFPVSTPEEARALINKTIEHYYSGGSWRNRALLLGAVLFYDTTPKEDGAKLNYYLMKDVFNPAFMDYTRMYEAEGTDPSEYEWDLPLNQTNVEVEWNKGVIAINSASHGSIGALWRAVKWDSWTSWSPFVSTGMNLTNYGKSSFFFAMACLSGGFDYPWDCLGEWLLNQRGGAIGYIGASRVAWVYVPWFPGVGLSEEHSYLFWGHFLRGESIGEALYNSKWEYYTMGFDLTQFYEKKSFLIFNLLGDPQLEIKPPKRIEVSPKYSKKGAVARTPCVEGNSAEFRIEVRNLLDREINLNLHCSPPPGWKLGYSVTDEDGDGMPNLRIDGGGSKTLEILVTPPEFTLPSKTLLHLEFKDQLGNTLETITLEVEVLETPEIWVEVPKLRVVGESSTFEVRFRNCGNVPLNVVVLTEGAYLLDPYGYRTNMFNLKVLEEKRFVLNVLPVKRVQLKIKYSDKELVITRAVSLRKIGVDEQYPPTRRSSNPEQKLIRNKNKGRRLIQQ